MGKKEKEEILKKEREREININNHKYEVREVFYSA